MPHKYTTEILAPIQILWETVKEMVNTTPNIHATPPPPKPPTPLPQPPLSKSFI